MRFLGTTIAVLLLSVSAHGAEPAGIEFFEQKIRPVFVRECYQCHSAQAKKIKGGFLLDTKAGLLKGGDSGPVIIPGKPVESRLLKALRHDEISMPPTGKLPDAVIADFERWIRMGAPDPRESKPATTVRTIDLEAGRRYWAFQPLRAPEIPQVADLSWPRNDMDRFILAALERKGLRPTRAADRPTLIRRVTIALTGLLPSPEEIEAFANDPAPDAAAFARLVDRLLVSPHFGERWGRHWLDVARYADSNGRDENLTFHESFRYRDYVIDSFNRDKPFDRFLMEQIAGDLLPATNQAQKDEQLTGTGFLVVGPKVLADRDFVKRKMDVVDEQVDTIGKVFLGLTLGCARCHDHKFDPIPTADYYALAGILASTHTLDGIKVNNAVVSGWMLRPLGPQGDTQHAAFQAHQKKRSALADGIKKVKAELKLQEDKATMRQPTRFAGIVVDDKDAQLIGTWKSSTFARPYVGTGYVHDDKAGKGEKSATFTPKLPKASEYDVQIAYTPSSNRATNTPVTIRFTGGEKTVLVNQTLPPKIEGLFYSVGKYRFEAGDHGSVTIANRDTEGYVIVDAVRFVPAGESERQAETVMGVPAEVRQKLADTRLRLEQLEAEEKALKAAAPPAPPLVMAVRDEEKIANARINIRGNPHALGNEVPRGFLQVVGSGAPIPSNQSGRLELAHWLTDSENPLPARVLVNRVWKHLFGEGLVRTVDNFGVQGERPSHPELLDFLALRFQEEGWSIKKLIRFILLSRAYQLGSSNDEALSKADPENRLLGRAHRRRLEAEVLRDTILQVSGRLDRTMGGSAVASLGERAIDNESKGGVTTDTNFRRSVYLPVIRNELPQFFEVFDFADPDVTVGRRDATTVPTQALFMMNSRFVMEQARETAIRLLGERSKVRASGSAKADASDLERLRTLYRLALGRTPTSKETRAALQFLKDYRQGAAPKDRNDAELGAWTGFCLAMFGCTEFRFVE